MNTQPASLRLLAPFQEILGRLCLWFSLQANAMHQDVKETDETVQHSAAPSSEYVPYHSEEYNIKLLYPKGWKMAEGNAGTGLCFYYECNLPHSDHHSRFICLA